MTLKTSSLDASILVIDDSSPDGTAEIVQEKQQKYPNILLYIRPKKTGLGTAITDGFKFFSHLKTSPKYVVTMDADYSHNPQDYPSAFSNHERKTTGIVIGSRYC